MLTKRRIETFPAAAILQMTEVSNCMIRYFIIIIIVLVVMMIIISAAASSSALALSFSPLFLL